MNLQLPIKKTIQIFSFDHRKIDSWNYPFIRVGTGYENNSSIKDTVEENIREKYNDVFSEGSGMWWIYKHLQDFGNPDYIGFCHYRRFLTLLKPNWGNFPIFLANTEYENKLNNFILNPETQLFLIQHLKCDGIVPTAFYDYGYYEKCKNIKELLKAESDKADMHLNMTTDLCNIAFDILYKNTPDEYKDSMLKTFNDLKTFHFNIFTISKQLFDIYNNIIWKSCDELYQYEQKNKIQNLDKRWMGFIIERYTSCILKMFQLQNYKFLELPLLIFH